MLSVPMIANSRFDNAEKKIKEMLYSKFGDPESEMYRIIRTCKDEQNGKKRMSDIMELWRFDHDTFSKLESIWNDVVGEKYEQIGFDNEI